MKPKTVKLGFAPTRRSIFSAPDAVKYANLTRQKLNELDVNYVDIQDINEEGLLYNEEDRCKILEKFKRENVKGLFVPHCNFGTEYIVARLAKDLGVPVLLWGPIDEAPDENGIRLRDSQCGLFATGKVLRRFNIKFSYLINCSLEDEYFSEGLRRFLAVCNVVDVFNHTRILQLGTRPFDFWSTMCNEGELLEKYNIQTAPIPLSELVSRTHDTLNSNKSKAIKDALLSQAYIDQSSPLEDDEYVDKICALASTIQDLLAEYGCNAGAIQCWNSLQAELGIMPCTANAILNEMGYPIACETDIHGAITSVMVEAATLSQERSFFADWTVRHPTNPNGELLQHCGPWPFSVLEDKPNVTIPLAFDYPGSLEGKAKDFDLMTVARFDGDHGDYSLLLGNAKSIEGPYTKGTYTWIEVENLNRLEAKLVTGPYIHHCVGINTDVVPVLYEACQYLDIKPDLYDENEDRVKGILYNY